MALNEIAEITAIPARRANALIAPVAKSSLAAAMGRRGGPLVTRYTHKADFSNAACSEPIERVVPIYIAEPTHCSHMMRVPGIAHRSAPNSSRISEDA